jgi:hypothetical protein
MVYMSTSYETLIHGLQAGRWLGRDTMGMGKLRGGVECVTQPFVCPILIHPVRRARVFVFVNSNIHELRISQFANICTKAHGAVLGGVGCPPRLPRGTSPRPHGALRTRFARNHRGVRFARYATRRRTHKAPIQPSKAYQRPHNNPTTHGSRWGKPPAPPAFIHVPRRVAAAVRLPRGCDDFTGLQIG